MGVTTPSGFVVPETIAQKAARLEAAADKEMAGGASTEQRLIALNRVISYFRGAGAKFLNREKLTPQPIH